MIKEWGCYLPKKLFCWLLHQGSALAPAAHAAAEAFPGWVFSDSRIHVVLCLSIMHLQEAALEKGRGRRGHILYTFTAQPTPQYKVPEGMSTEEEYCCPEELPLKLSCREYKHILCCSLLIKYDWRKGAVSFNDPKYTVPPVSMYWVYPSLPLNMTSQVTSMAGLFTWTPQFLTP